MGWSAQLTKNVTLSYSNLTVYQSSCIIWSKVWLKNVVYYTKSTVKYKQQVFCKLFY